MTAARRGTTARPLSDTLEVWLDADLVAAPTRVGWLSHDRGHIRFNYDASWLTHQACFSLDPDLSLHDGMFYPGSRLGNFGIFLDSAPDRWGQTLMDRREMLQAKDNGRPARTLHAWDYLVGVQDETRQGALRFRLEGTTVFLDNQLRSAPPVTTLPQLQAVAFELTRRHIDDLDQLRQWLAVLVAPGASLGGARPKANFVQPDGSLWIAKFPSRDDRRDIAAWEHLVHTLAIRAGVVMAPSELVRLGDGHRTFCTRRFDRTPTGRVFYMSAMTALRKDPSDSSSYLDLAQFLSNQGATSHRAQDLRQLYTRVVFNVATGNRDDHLRNHGFLLTADGWRLAPAFDVNPAPDKDTHVLALDDGETRPRMETVVQTAELYGLTTAEGQRIVDGVATHVRPWRTEAARLGISAADVEFTAPAFGST